MLVTMLDEKTYVIRDTALAVGKEIHLEKIPPISFCGTKITLVEINKGLTARAEEIRATRQALCTALHTTNDFFDDDTAEKAARYENLQRDWLFFMDLLYKAIQQHLGGTIPLHRDAKTGKVTVRKKDPNEVMNYTRDAVSTLVHFSANEPLRNFLLRGGAAVDDFTVESDVHLDTRMPCLSALPDPSNVGPVLEAGLLQHDVLEKDGTPTILAWVASDRTYFLDARGALPPGQQYGNEVAALNVGLLRAQAVLRAPKSVSTLCLVRSVKREGSEPEQPGPSTVLVTTYASDTEVPSYVEYPVEDNHILPERKHEGAGVKLHTHLDTQIRALFRKK